MILNSQDSQTLMEDVPVTLDRLRDATVDWDPNDVEGAEIKIIEAAENMAYAVGKDALDFTLSLAVAGNFSETTVNASPDRSTLRLISGKMNIKGAGPERIGIVNTAVYDSLDADPEITSSDFSGQMTGGNPWGSLSNVAGWKNIFEYPVMPKELTPDFVTGVFFDPRAFVMVNRALGNVEKLREALGIPLNYTLNQMTDPATGLTMQTYSWMTSPTKIYTKIVMLYGVSAGKQGGATGTKTDFAGHLLTSQ